MNKSRKAQHFSFNCVCILRTDLCDQNPTMGGFYRAIYKRHFKLLLPPWQEGFE